MHFGEQWNHVAYHLGVDNSSVKNVDIDYRKSAEKAFAMLTDWIEKDVHACYCKVVFAMKKLNLNEQVHLVKSIIESSKLSF